MLLSMLLLLLLLHRSPCERQLHTKSAAVSQAVYAMSFLVSYGDVRCEMWSTKDSSILLLLPHSPLPPCNNKADYYTNTDSLSPSFTHRIPSSNTSKDHRPLRSTEISHNHNEKSSTFAFFSTNCLFLLYEEEEEEEEKKRSLLATPPSSVQKHSLLKPFQIRKSSQFSKNSTSQTPDTNYTKIKKERTEK